MEKAKKQPKELKVVAKECEADDVDEGVQHTKKSIVPVRCISNLMLQGASGSNSFDSGKRKPKTIHGSMDRTDKFKPVSTISKPVDTASKLSSKAMMLRETSLK